MPKYVLDDCVHAEVWTTWQFIAQDNPEAATRVITAIYGTFRALVNTPNIGRKRHFPNFHLKDVRSWRVSDFEHYHIFYRPVPEGIHVLHVIHDAQDIEALFETR